MQKGSTVKMKNRNKTKIETTKNAFRLPGAWKGFMWEYTQTGDYLEVNIPEKYNYLYHLKVRCKSFQFWSSSRNNNSVL